MQTMLRMIGFGDNAGSGFPAILSAWETEGWIKPELKEEIGLNQVTLTLTMEPDWIRKLKGFKEEMIEHTDGSEMQIQEITDVFNYLTGVIFIETNKSMDATFRRLAAYGKGMSIMHIKKIMETSEFFKNAKPEKEKLVCDVRKLMEDLGKSAEPAENSAEKSAESAEKSADQKETLQELSKRQKQILDCMQQGESYSTEEIAQMINLKGPRTRQLLNELVAMDLVSCTAATKNRRYIKK